MSDQIQINGLRVVTSIGVTEEERAVPQSVSVSINITPKKSFKGFNDRIENTINYYEVSQAVRKKAAEGERNLIETLAEDLADAVLDFNGVCAITLSVEKFIIPDCDSVSVTITRAREG